MSRISIIVPCYNEATIIQSTVKEITHFVSQHCSEYDLELLVVDDGSTDSTRVELEKLQQQIPGFHLISFETNRGRGAAIKAGIAKSTGDYVITLDADLSYSVDHILKIMTAFRDNPQCDAVVVSPYMKGGQAKNIPLSRLLLSRCANYLLSGYFSQRFSTVTCMVRGYRGSVIRSLPVFHDSKELHLEILRKLTVLGEEVMEIPGTLVWRNAKERAGRLNKKKVLNSARKHLLYGFLNKPTRFISTFGLLLLMIGLYETCVLAFLFLQRFELSEPSLIRSVWVTLSDLFAQSPHTAFIAAVSLMLSAQVFSFVGVMLASQVQHEETLRHILELLKRTERA